MTLTALNLNCRAGKLVETMLQDTESLGISTHVLPCGAKIVDCGVKEAGSREAGLRLAEICLSGLASIRLLNADENAPLEQVEVTTEEPLAACMASQYAGWQVKGEKFFAMGSGPMRAAIGKEALFDHIGLREAAPLAVGILECSKIPTDAVCQMLAADCRVPPSALTLLVARTASLAGTVQIVARSVETAMHKLHEVGFDIRLVRRGIGTAPLPPVGKDDLAAIGLTNDAILYGGNVALSMDASDTTLQEIGPKIPSSASSDYGRPFAEIFQRYGGDFYKIDPRLFSPARITLISTQSGKSFTFGELDWRLVRESFGI